MATKLLKFNDGVLVEVGVQRDQAQEMSVNAAERLKMNFEAACGLLRQIATPIKGAFANLADELKTPIKIETAEVELGLSFSAEGNLFVTKATGEASLKIKLVFKRKD